MDSCGRRTLPCEGEGRHLNRQELATMSTLEQRLQGRRAVSQTLQEKQQLKAARKASFRYKDGDIKKNYDLQNELGGGHFAKVKKAREKASGKIFAAKIIRKKKSKTCRDQGVSVEEIEREIEILSELSYPRIVKLHETWRSAKETTLVLEFVPGGTLAEFMETRTLPTERLAAGIIRQILETVDHMHERKIAHFDLKPHNIMVMPGYGSDGTTPRIKLVDFGLAQRFDVGSEVNAMQGTPEYVAPEVLAFEPVGSEADLWSIGVITFMLLSGVSPFLGHSSPSAGYKSSYTEL